MPKILNYYHDWIYTEQQLKFSEANDESPKAIFTDFPNFPMNAFVSGYFGLIILFS